MCCCCMTGLFNVGNRLLVSINLFLKIRNSLKQGQSPSQAAATALDHNPNHTSKNWLTLCKNIFFITFVLVCSSFAGLVLFSSYCLVSLSQFTTCAWKTLLKFKSFSWVDTGPLRVSQYEITTTWSAAFVESLRRLRFLRGIRATSWSSRVWRWWIFGGTKQSHWGEIVSVGLKTWMKNISTL